MQAVAARQHPQIPLQGLEADAAGVLRPLAARWGDGHGEPLDELPGQAVQLGGALQRGLCGPGPRGAPAGAGGAGGGDPGAGAAGGGRLEVLERLARDYAGWTADRPAPGLDRLGTLRDQVGGRPACPLMHPDAWPALPAPPRLLPLPPASTPSPGLNPVPALHLFLKRR